MFLRNFSLTCLIVFIFTGCSTIAEKTNMLTDDDIKSQSSGALGYSADDLTLIARRTEGTNTYANLKSKDGREFTCVINGGNFLSMGMTNPPSCNVKGQPIKTNPFQK